jgi:hypothetical protein
MNAPEPRGVRNRGVAMFLVLIALGVGIVLAGVAITSRQPAPQIGRHAVEMSAAQWSAEGAARYAEAMLESYIDWQAGLGADSLLLENFSVGGGLVDVTVKTPEGNTPGPDDREIILTATAHVGPIQATIERHLSVTPTIPIDNAVTLELPEFAVFAKNSYTREEGATLGLWGISPEADTIEPFRIGTGFASSGSLVAPNDGTANNIALIVDDNAGGSLRSIAESVGNGSRVLSYKMPTVPEQLPAFMKGLPIVRLTDWTISSGALGTATASAGGTFQQITVTNGSTLILDATKGDKYKFKNLTLEKASTLQVVGTVYVHVEGTISLKEKSVIAFGNASSSVVFFTGGDVSFDDSVVALTKAVASNTTRSTTSVVTYYAPARCRFLALGSASGGKVGSKYDFMNRALAVASLHNPEGTVEIGANCGLIGRTTAGDFRLREGASLLYDPRLDPRIGYCAENGPLYGTDGLLLPEIATALGKATTTLGMTGSSVMIADAAKAALAETVRWKPLSTATATTAGGFGLEPLVKSTTTVVEEVIDDLLGGDEDDEAAASLKVRTKGKLKSRRPAHSAWEMEDDD